MFLQVDVVDSRPQGTRCQREKQLRERDSCLCCCVSEVLPILDCQPNDCQIQLKRYAIKTEYDKKKTFNHECVKSV